MFNLSFCQFSFYTFKFQFFFQYIKLNKNYKWINTKLNKLRFLLLFQLMFILFQALEMFFIFNCTFISLVTDSHNNMCFFSSFC